MAAVLLPAQAALAFTDVPSNYWDYSAIKYEAIDHPWMQDYGTGLFKPATNEARQYLARAMVEMFAPNEPIDPRIHFPDLADSSPFYRYANVAAKLGWIGKFKDGNWYPGLGARKAGFDEALVKAMGLTAPVQGLANLHQDNGTKYSFGGVLPYMQLATYLGLHYDHSDDSIDLEPTSWMRRDEVAYSLWWSKNVPSWELSNTTRFDNISLPSLNASVAGDVSRQTLTQFALNQIGIPYTWGGEWNVKTPPGYCCGSQTQGGFDCSGFSWWVLKRGEDGYNAAQYHPAYIGWSLHERTSSQMAEYTTTRVAFAGLSIGNLMFFASNGGHTWQDVNHVGIYIGNGWMIHSTAGGPQIEWANDGWYHDHFVWGRALHSRGDAPPAGGVPLLVGERALNVSPAA
jgi:hypothetical protein